MSLSGKTSDIKPIRVIGGILIASGCIAALYFFLFFLRTNSPLYVLGTNPPPMVFFCFGLVFIVFTLATGVGTLFLTHWGYLLLKLLLYIMYIGFPIGTMFSYITFSYIEKHDIKRYFKKNTGREE